MVSSVWGFTRNGNWLRALQTPPLAAASHLLRDDQEQILAGTPPRDASTCPQNGASRETQTAAREIVDLMWVGMRCPQQLRMTLSR
jgi:hypothetical protein